MCLFVYVRVLTDETEKVKVEPNESASAHGQSVDGQKGVKVTPAKAVEARSVRSKRAIKGEGKPARVTILF